jgi:glycosyltransferase involved in cell wall biosynthesis
MSEQNKELSTIRIAVVIPAFNEEASLAAVVESVHTVRAESGIFIRPVVVNDCSRDATQKIIEKLDCVALNLPVNLGIGGAVQTGIKYAYDNGYDYFIQIDGDGQHPPHHIPELLKSLLANNWDVVIGSRYLKKEGFQSTIFRRMGIYHFQLLNKLLTGKTVTDSTSGMRMMNRKAMKVLYAYYPDEYPEPEAIIIFAKNNLVFGEVPVTMEERMGGVSSIQSFDALYYMFKVSLAVIFTYIKK